MHLDFRFHNKLVHPQGVKSFKTMALIRTENSATDFFVGEKEK